MLDRGVALLEDLGEGADRQDGDDGSQPGTLNVGSKMLDMIAIGR